jgi:octaprenyl-diphosphate synthase
MSTEHLISEIIEPIHPIMQSFQLAFQCEFERIQAQYHLKVQPAALFKGKSLRPILFFLCQGLIDSPRSDSVNTAVMIELVHTASLLHDDVIDESLKRRGEKTLNAIRGNHFSVLLGDYLIARMMTLGQEMKNGGMHVLSQAILMMTLAEIKQALCENQCLEEHVYMDIIEGKTGALFQATTDLAASTVHASKKVQLQLRELGLQFGLAFQIQDDILDYTGSSGTLGKPVHQDLLKGQFTLPFILAFEELSVPERESLFQQLSNNELPHEHLVQLVKNQGIEKTKDRLLKYSQQALSLLHQFPENRYKTALENLFHFNMERHL